MTAQAPLSDVTAGLGALRRRLRGLLLLHGVARIVVATAVAALLFFAADVFLDLPLGVRRFVRLGLVGSPGLLPLGLTLPLGVLLLGLALLLSRAGHAAAGWAWFAGGGLALWLLWWAWRGLRPMSLRMPDERLVLEVERRHPELGDRLAAALDFSRELRAPSRDESLPMMQAVVAEASRTSRGLAFGAAASGRTALMWTAGAALCALVAGSMLALDPAKTALWARRSLLGEDVPWPRASHVFAVALEAADGGSDHPWPPERSFEVAVGRSLVVHARVVGRSVDEVHLLDLAEGQLPLARRMFPVAGRAGLYSVELTNVRQGFRFVLRGGDDDDSAPVYRVEATVPPSVLGIGAELTFPAYLKRAPERVEGGNLAVPEGTQVSVTFAASSPLASARAFLGEQTSDAERVSGDGGGEAWRFTFRADRPLRYRLALRTLEGRENDPSSESYDVAVEEDRRPRAEWLWPRAGTSVTPNGRVPLLARSLDDHALSEVKLELRVGAEGPPWEVDLQARNAEAGTPTLLTRDGRRYAETNDGPLGRPQVLTYLPLDVATLAPEGGWRLPATVTVRLLVRDGKGQLGEGPWQALEIIGAPELERELATRRAQLKSSILALRTEQQAREEQARATAQGPLEEADRDALKTIQFAQGKIEQHAARAVRDFLDLFSAFVLDRLGAENPNERILALMDRHHRRTFGVAPTRGAGAAGPGIDAYDDAVFPYALFSEVVEAWRGRALLDNGVLDRMCAVLAEAVSVAADLAPRAHAEAVRAASGSAAEVAELVAAQRRLLVSLDKLLSLMGSWESLSDVIVQLRRLVEEQRSLLDQLDHDLDPKKPNASPNAPSGEGPKEGDGSAPSPPGR